MIKRTITFAVLVLFFISGILLHSLASYAEGSPWPETASYELTPEETSFASSNVDISQGSNPTVGTDRGTPIEGNLLYSFGIASEYDASRLCLQARLVGFRVQASLSALIVSEEENTGKWTTYLTNDLNSVNKVTNYSFLDDDSGELDTNGIPARGSGTSVLSSGNISYTVSLDDLSGPPEDYYVGLSYSGYTDAQYTVSMDAQYDNSECIGDLAITKTLLNPDSVQPGGEVSFEIRLENKGNNPYDFGQDGGVYDFYSPDLSYVSSSSDSPGLICADLGLTLNDVFGQSEGEATAFKNHLDYGMAFCSETGAEGYEDWRLAPGDSVVIQMNFVLSSGASFFENYTLSFGSYDSDILNLLNVVSDIVLNNASSGDVLDYVKRGDLEHNNISRAAWGSVGGMQIQNSSGLSDNGRLADTGDKNSGIVAIGMGLCSLAGLLLVARRIKEVQS